MTDTRKPITVRMSDAGIAALDTIAERDFDGNRSLALRKLMEYAVANWPKEKR